jgi:hypothetical protein
LAIGVLNVILESGANVEFLEANTLQERADRFLGRLLHEISVPGVGSFIHTEVVSKVFSVEGLDLLGGKIAASILGKFIVNEVVIIIHVALDDFVVIG